MSDREDQTKTLNRRERLAFIAAVMVFIGLAVTYCSVAPKTEIQPVQTPPPATCDDGSPVGKTRDAQTQCPAGQTGKVTEVCTVAGWKPDTNTCSATPPACNKTQFADVQPVLDQYCAGCHSPITTYATAKSWSSEIERRITLPQGNNEHMPQNGSTQLPGDKVNLLKKWVDDGAPQDCSTAATPTTFTEDYLVSVMNADATSINPVDRPFIRYLVTAGAANDGITGDQMQAWIDGLNKGVNMLNTTTQDLIPATPVDSAKVVWRIDVRDYGLTLNDIATIDGGDVNINIVDNTSKGLVLQALLGNNGVPEKHPWFHADNFLDIAFRNANVYYALTRVPPKLSDYQKNIGVDFQGNLSNLEDINFIGSIGQITEQKNRLITRTIQGRAGQAYYWQTFDVNAVPNNVVVNGINEDTKNLFQFPLLPNTGKQAAGTASVANFTQDASETIVQLPNGMQGYALWDAQGNRLNAADPNVVIDTQTPLGNKVITVGNTCGRCHNAGVIPMADTVLAHVNANADQFLSNDVQLVRAVYKEAGVNSALFALDSKQYNANIGKLGIKPGPDPMSIVTDRFLENWTLTQAAGFLFLTPDQFKDALNESPTAKGQIGALLTGGTVPAETFFSVIQQLIKDARLFQDPLGT